MPTTNLHTVWEPVQPVQTARQHEQLGVALLAADAAGAADAADAADAAARSTVRCCYFSNTFIIVSTIALNCKLKVCKVCLAVLFGWPNQGR